MTVYKVKVKKGKFKGHELYTHDYPTYIMGFGSPWIACFDNENNEYCIYWSELKVVEKIEIMTELVTYLKAMNKEGEDDADN